MTLIPKADQMSHTAFLRNLEYLAGRNSALLKHGKALVAEVTKQEEPEPKPQSDYPIQKSGGWWEFSDGSKQRGLSEEDANKIEQQLNSQKR